MTEDSFLACRSLGLLSQQECHGQETDDGDNIRNTNYAFSYRKTPAIDGIKTIQFHEIHLRVSLISACVGAHRANEGMQIPEHVDDNRNESEDGYITQYSKGCLLYTSDAADDL